MTDKDVSHVWGILTSLSKSRVFMVRVGSVWTLPDVKIDNRVRPMQLRRIGRAFEKVLGLPVLAICPLDYETDVAEVRGVFLLDTHKSDTNDLVGGTWVDRQMLKKMDLKYPEHQSFIESVLDDGETARVPPLLVSWGKLGWYPEALGWFEEQLVQRGHKLQKPIEQVRISGRTCLLKADTMTGGFYFKMASSYPSVYCSEPVMVKLMNQAYPKYVPKPVAVDLERRWMIFENWKPLATRSMTSEDLVAAWQVWGQIQVDFIGKDKDLLDLGCPDRRLSVLVTQIDSLITDPLVRRHLDCETLRAFASQVPKLKALCQELADYNLPSTLLHGDFCGGNMALFGDTCTFHDWTDACLGHPFLELKDVVDEHDEMQLRIRDAYLAAWVRYAPLDQLQKAWEVARPLSALHHAVRNQIIAHAQEPLWYDGFNYGIQSWIKKTLRLLG